MCINPPAAVAVATIYRSWARTQLTSAFERLGDALAVLAKGLGGWDAVHQFCADFLPSIPTEHLKLAYADHVRRAYNILSH